MQNAPKLLALLACITAGSFMVATPTHAMVAARHYMGLDSHSELALPFEEVGGIVRVNIDEDPELELIASGGIGQSPTVSVLDNDGTQLHTFLSYAPNYDRGVTLAVGDVTGNGVAEIVTGTMYGGGPHVRVFQLDGTLVGQFFAYAQDFRGGVSVATADTDGNGIDEIVTGPGIGGGPHVRIFTPYGDLYRQFFAFEESYQAGLSLTAIDPDEDGREELVASHLGSSAPEARVISFTKEGIHQLAESFPILDGSHIYGTTLFPVNDHAFGVTTNGHTAARVQMYTADGMLAFDHLPFSETETRRLLAAGTSAADLLAVRTRPLLHDRVDKHVYVNLEEQRLYAYNHGLVENTFLISAGRWPFKTPTGEFAVMRKLRWHDYRWSYGEDDPRNYDLSDVEYNLEFTRHYYIHHAYWHSNWGNPMSHGCVNAPYEGVKWVYEWADVGTPVIVE